MIEVRHVSKAYHKDLVLKDVSFTIKNQTLTMLIGGNGAGKSTALHIMSRLIGRNTGHISIDGKPIEAYDSYELAKKLSILKQTNPLSVRMKVYDMVCFGRYPYTKGRLNKEDYQKVEEALHWLSIFDIKDQYIDELSGGQRQRVLIAMMLAQDSEYMLLDEPLNNLDIKHSTEMMTLLKRLVKEKNKTIVMVAHDINYTSAYADHIIAFKDGKIIDQGQTKQVIDQDRLGHIFDHEFEIIDFQDMKLCQYYKRRNK